MFTKTLAFSVLALAASATSRATVVVDNLTTNGAAYATTGNSIGQSFTTSTTPVSLVDVVFPQMAGSQAAGYTYGYVAGETFSLYGNAIGNSPDFSSVLGTFTLTASTVTAGNPGFAQTTADTTSPISLAANSRYWLVLSSGGATTTYWSAPDVVANGYIEKDALGLSLATDARSAYKTVGATTTYYSYAAGPQLIYIDAVPEPSSVVLLALAGAGALSIVRRVRTAKAA